MNPHLAILLIIALVAILTGVSYYTYRPEEARAKSLRAIAGKYGWAFDAISSDNHRTRYKPFEYFTRGHSQLCQNTVEGELKINDIPHHFKMGDYLYECDDDDSKDSVRRFSYICLHLPYSRVPDLFIRQETLSDRIGSAFGFIDINFESERFSNTFHVSSTDRRFAYDVITPEAMEFLLKVPEVGVELRDGILCFVSESGRWGTAEFMPRLKWAVHFIDLWPDHVIHAYTEAQA
ncbi:MAG: hypothetical protein ED559_10290 [Phycisphaera sp.]|nr:MAG: hypothetical protein ED559_10290 [Phycisphaera sp.]